MVDASGVDPVAVWRAGRNAALLVDHSSRGRITLTGKSRQRLLHRITTNDIESLQPGEGVVSLLVTPKGRIIERLLVLCRRDDLLLITSDGGREIACDGIRKYIVIEDVKVNDRTERTFQLGLYGPRAGQVLEQAGAGAGDLPLFHHTAAQLGGRSVVLATEPGTTGPAFVVVGEAADRQAVHEHLLARGEDAGMVEGGTDAFEPLRVAVGLPACGHELTEKWNPLEARQEDAISFDKGCYVGQEVIARLQTYDKVTRRLIRLEVEGGEPLAAGTRVDAPGAAGIITSAAPVPDERRTVALAVVGAGLAPDAELTVGEGADRRRARVTGEPATARQVRQEAPEPLVPSRKRFGS